MKHFKLTEESKVNSFGAHLFRIQATKDSYRAKKGDLGGWVEKEENLQGNAWVGDEAEVWGNAKVYDNALVYGNARVSDNAKVLGDALVSGDAQVCGDAQVWGDAWVYGNAQVRGNALVFGNAHISGKASVHGNAQVWGNAKVCGDAQVYSNAHVCGTAHVYGNAIISTKGKIQSNNDYCCFQNFGSENRCTTFFKQQDNSIRVSCGCFTGSIQEFEKQVITTHGQNKHAKEYLAIIQLAKLKFGLCIIEA